MSTGLRHGTYTDPRPIAFKVFAEDWLLRTKPAVRRTFIALHVEAGTHPKLVQERVGHSNIKLTMDVYGKLAGKMALGEEQAARLDSRAGLATLPLVSTWAAGDSKTAHISPEQPERHKAISA